MFSACTRCSHVCCAFVDAVAGAKAAAGKEAGLHKAIAALTRIEDAERQLRAARAAAAGEGEGEGGGFALRYAELIGSGL